jgi:uncharacterized protein (TIGR00369 family)
MVSALNTRNSEGMTEKAGHHASGGKWHSYPPFYTHLGLTLESIGDGQCVLRLPYAKHFGNTRGEVHGGIAASILDIAMSQALRSTIEGPADIATISLNVSYLAPAMGVLICNGKVMRRGRSVAFVEGEVRGENGESAARAVGTFRILRKHVA